MLTEKKCTKCKTIKSIFEFNHAKRYKDGFSCWCKECIKKYTKNYYKNNLVKLKKYREKWYKNNSKKHAENCRQWEKNNPEKVREIKKRDHSKNKDKYSKRYKKWIKENPERIKELKYSSKRKQLLIPQNKINHQISNQIRQSLKGKKNGRHWESLIGYSLEDLIIHLEKLFKPGMSWENYGEWHIDHRKPISSFNFTSPEDPEFKQCWALSNLQPLWAEENILKGSKIFYGVKKNTYR